MRRKIWPINLKTHPENLEPDGKIGQHHAGPNPRQPLTGT
jgi:hypothetical protein